MDKLSFSNEYFYDEVRDGFYIPEMMKRYWAAQLEVLKVIDDICRKHNLKWFANYGTLLGAVRHNGYIPWDDDLDITMLRDDYDRFFELAEKELPEGYCILTAEREEDYAYTFGRITNSHSIDMTPDFLAKYHGCPYVVGVDIYPFDNIYDDPHKEENRLRRGKEIFEAMKMLNTQSFPKSELEKQLRKTEEITGESIDRSKNLDNQLCKIMNKICIEAREEASKDVTLEYSWIFWHGYKFPREYFDSYIEVPFETTTVTVPANYNEILTALFSDYMVPIRPGGLHDFPVFKEQEAIYRKAKGANPFRYTLRSENLPPLHQGRIRTDYEGKDILFLPCRIDWWETLKPVFEGAVAAPGNTVSIIPIPHFDCDFLGNVSEPHINEEDFLSIPEIRDYITTFEKYGFGPRRPDVIVIQVPFDAYSCALTVPEILYSDNLLKYTDELVYVPCFDTAIPESDNDKIVAALQYLIEQPAVVNADRIILKHERIKEIYLNSLISLTSPEYRNYWEKKLCLLSEVEWCQLKDTTESSDTL